MMATAVARARIEQESRSLRDALWRADRLLRAGTISLAIAHELNQPIAAILTNAQAALRYLDSDRADRTAVRDTIRDALRAIVRDDQRAAETVRAIRRMARRDDGERTSVDLRQVVGEVLVLLQDDLRRAHVKVVLAIEPGLVVRADRVQLQQVALNLIQNATTAMARVAADARTVTIAGCRPDALRVRWSVEDTGPGVAPEHAEAVFEPLQATPADRTGLGLGLSICRKIVELHGGTIRVVEGTDRGARFEIELPAGPDEREPHGQAPSPSREAPAPVGTGSVVPRTVFVVDDDPATREAIARLLRAAGWAVRCIASGREALDDPDLDAVACVLLDVRMEGLSGPQTFEAMRARGVATPVLFLTADDDVRQGVEAIRLGALDYLVKPADPDTLLAAVETAAAARMRIDAAAREGRLRRQRLESLTGRERDVMREVLRGRLNKQIAADLGISEATVKQHRARVMAKMGVRSVAELVHACEGGDPGPSRATVRPAAGPDA
jgi:FixJ family two-component response regulator/nitrogen-specific signal transduction histidine kinase